MIILEHGGSGSNDHRGSKEEHPHPPEKSGLPPSAHHKSRTKSPSLAPIIHEPTYYYGKGKGKGKSKSKSKSKGKGKGKGSKSKGDVGGGGGDPIEGAYGKHAKKSSYNGATQRAQPMNLSIYKYRWRRNARHGR